MGLRSTMRCCFLLCLAPSVYCHGFLETGGEADRAVPDMMALLLSEANPMHLFPIRRDLDFPDLQAMFKSLPKNMHDIVANALHTYGKFESKGLSLPALASLVGTFDDLVRGEVAVHVDSAYKINGYAVESAISGAMLKSIARDYMTVYISGTGWKAVSRKNIEVDEKFLAKYTKSWADDLAWIQQTTVEEAKKEPNCQHDDLHACKFDYNSTVGIVKHVVEKYGHYNDHECHKIKAGLLKMEEPRTGRVHLSDFYKAGLSGAWQFNEKIDYLRILGALDESKPSQPRVIVTNYLSSWPNCVSSSRFYSVCCPNECEDLMRIIENHVVGPTVGVDQMMRLIETQPALSEHASTQIGYFRDRLVDIAKRHHGKVPLHGRLFAQWMHHVFPHTCPYPHEADSMSPMSPDQWMAQTGQDDIKASEEEIRHTMRSLSIAATGVTVPKPTDLPGDIPWSDVEDSLVIIRSTPAPEMGNKANRIEVVEAVGVVGLVIVVMRLASYKLKQRKLPKTKDLEAQS